MPAINADLFLTKVQTLPDYLQKEVIDFIDYLLSKHKIPIRNAPLSEDEMEKNIELSCVNDSQEDYLTKHEVEYYLNLKDED